MRLQYYLMLRAWLSGYNDNNTENELTSCFGTIYLYLAFDLFEPLLNKR